jgi:hypothetical protein
MPDRMFYIEGSWLTYEQAHNLGYSLLPQRLVTFYSISNDSVVIKQDSGDNTYYDSANHAWVVDFADLNLYKRVSNKTFYRGESSADYRCYIASITESTSNYLFCNTLIMTLSDAYDNYGITSYECENIILDSSESPVVWFDLTTGKYFDDRDGFHRWVDSIDDEKVVMYDSSATESSRIYENEVADYFYINDSFISRNEFYIHDNYGIVRENVYVLKDDEVYNIYYDSYSDEYCIPEVTEIWISKDDLLELGYIFVEGIADMRLREMTLHLPWKYLPSSATLSFTNTSHSDLSITLPEDIEDSIGSEIVLPEITGVYTDDDSIRWVATRWDIGEFNSTFILNENTVADLECEKVRVTLLFINSHHQTLEIPLPEPITVDNGDLVTLPLVTGEYEDEDHIKWYPLRWDIGEFGSSYLLSNDTSAAILCERQRFEEITVYVKSGWSAQTSVYSSHGGGGNTHTNVNTNKVYDLYSDSSYSTVVYYQRGKRYEIGYYNGSEWVKYIDTIPKMPVNSLSSTVYGTIPYCIPGRYGNCPLGVWQVTNGSSSPNFAATSYIVRIYDDAPETMTVYIKEKQIYQQSNIGANRLPITSMTYKLYSDPEMTVPIPYDNTKKYMWRGEYHNNYFYTLDEFLGLYKTSSDVILLINKDGYLYAWSVTTKSSAGNLNLNSHEQTIRMADV